MSPSMNLCWNYNDSYCPKDISDKPLIPLTEEFTGLADKDDKKVTIQLQKKYKVASIVNMNRTKLQTKSIKIKHLVELIEFFLFQKKQKVE